jgi:hypothetical protein
VKKLLALVILAFALSAGPAWAQTGGPVNIKATDTATGASTEVGDNTNHAIRVNVVAGSSGNAAASATGSAVPASASYDGINVAGTLRGATGVNPSGSVYATQTDITSVGGTTVVTGNGTASGALRVALPTDGTGVVGLIAGSAIVGKVGIDQTTPGTTNGAAIIGVNGATALAGNGVTGTGSLRVTIASDNTAFSVNAVQSGTWNVGTLTSITNAVITKPVDACGTTNYDGQVIVAGTTLTALTASTTCVDSVVITNTGSASLTALLQDTSGTPITMIPTTSIAPNSSLALNLGGMKFTSGIKYQLSAATGTVLVKGRQ